MRKILALVLVVVLGVLSGCASQAPRNPVFMWEAQKDGATIHLLGSIHAGQDSWYPLDASITDALAAADTVACEINVNDPEVQMQTMLMVQQEGMYPEGESLQQHISPETWQELQSRLEGQVPAAVLDRMRPGMAAMMVAQVTLAQAGLDMSSGVDMHVLSAAQEHGQPIVALETVADQVALLFGDDAVIDAKMLSESLEDDAETMVAMLDTMVSTWAAGDAEGLEAVYREDWMDDESMQRFHEELLVKRNQGMADGLANRGGRWFVVVGALHMCGESGVPALLAEAGWKVEQVEKAAPVPEPVPEPANEH